MGLMDRLKYYLFYKPWRSFDLAVLADDGLRKEVSATDKGYKRQLLDISTRFENERREVLADLMEEETKTRRLIDTKETEFYETFKRVSDNIVKARVIGSTAVEDGIELEKTQCAEILIGLKRDMINLDKQIEGLNETRKRIGKRYYVLEQEIGNLYGLESELIDRTVCHRTEYSKKGIWGQIPYKFGQNFEKWASQIRERKHQERMGRLDNWIDEGRKALVIDQMRIEQARKIDPQQVRGKVDNAYQEQLAYVSSIEKEMLEKLGGNERVRENTITARRRLEDDYKHRIGITYRIEKEQRETFSEKVYEALSGFGKWLYQAISRRDYRRERLLDRLRINLGGRLDTLESTEKFFSYR